MHNRIFDRHVSDRRKAFILKQRIPQETRFTFDPFEPDMNYEVQDVPLREVPKWILAIIVAALIAVVLFVMLGWYVKNRVDQNTEVRRRNDVMRNRTYRSWESMISRCCRAADRKYPLYGGRGIVVCDRWRHSYKHFLADMGERPEGASLDRIDSDGNYEPENCRWATIVEQNRNKRTNRYLEYNGERLLFTDWLKRTGLSLSTLRNRLLMGWTVEEALTTKPGEKRQRTVAADGP